MSPKHSLATRSLVAFTIITCTAGLVFLLPAPRGANAGEKDALERQRKVIAELQATVNALETKLAESLAEQRKLKNILGVRDTEVKLLQERNRDQEATIRRMEQTLLTLEGMKGIAPPPRTGPPLLKPNPPAVRVNGAVVKSDPKNPGLVEISLGADEGVAVGHTLDVYRLKPTPRYLGMLRVVAVMPHRAIGQLVVPAGTPPIAIQVGDQVSSERTAPKE